MGYIPRTQIIRTFVFLIIAAAFPSLAFAETDDPFYGQKGTDAIIEAYSSAPFQDVVETVDPFTGNLNLLHTDVLLPGNGGLDLKIQRSYNSRIRGGRPVSTLVADAEKSLLGLGWSFHFGRVRNPGGTGIDGDNPIIEMPDGSTYPVYRDKSTSGDKITRNQWIYRLDNSNTTTTQYELILTDGTVYKFSIGGQFGIGGVTVYQVESITTTNGNTITFEYDQTDRRKITAITDSTGRTNFTFSYGLVPGTAYEVLQTLNVNGKNYRYLYESYNAQTLLKEVDPPVGPSWKYTYHKTNPSVEEYELKSVTYPNGAVLTYAYSNVLFDTGLENQLFTVVTRRTLSGRGVNTTSWDYDYKAASGSEQVTTITHSGCASERYTFASIAELGDGLGTKGKLWKVGKLLKKEILEGSTARRTEVYNWSAGPSVSNENLYWSGSTAWDPEIYVPRLDSTSITQDGKTYTTSYSNYDAYNNPRTISESGDRNRTTTLTYFYNTGKNIVSNYPKTQNVTVAGKTFSTDFGYDSNGNLKTYNRYGVLTTFGYSSGNMTSRKDANNRTTNFQYDRGVVKKITNPIYSISRTINWEGTIKNESNGRNYTTYFQYDSLNRIKLIDPPTGNSTTISYDNSGGVYWKISKGSNFLQNNLDGLGRLADTSASEGIKTNTNYNVCGQVNYRSYPYDASTTQVGDDFLYDILGRIKKVTHPDNTTQDYTYPSGDTSVNNERNISIRYGYESFGDPDEKRLTSVADATGTTVYEYNTVGSLTKIRHPGTLVRSFKFNSKNFLENEIHPETGTISYLYDAVGNMRFKTDGKGTSEFVYDAINRLKTIDPPGSSNSIGFTYDNADNRKTMSSAGSSHSYTYDQVNRLKSESVTIDGESFLSKYDYDTQGNLEYLTYPTGRKLHYFYDSADRIEDIAGYVSNVVYHPSGGIKHLQYGNSKRLDFTYDNRHRVKTQKTASIIDRSYQYDGVDNVKTITDWLNSSKTQSMTYDNVDRLKTASGIWGNLSYTYSTMGNRLTKTLNTGLTNYNYSGSTNRLTSISGAESETFAYDNNSNMSDLRGRLLAYDPLNRLIEVDGGNITYTYNGDGKRIKKVDHTIAPSGKTTLYHYDIAGNILLESDPDGTPQAEYVYLNGQHIAKISGGEFTPPTEDPPVEEPPVEEPIQILTVFGIFPTAIHLSWQAFGDGSDPYEVWRCEGIGCISFLKIGEYSEVPLVPGVIYKPGIGPSFYDSGLKSSTVYRYQVTVSGKGSNRLTAATTNDEGTPTPLPVEPSELTATAVSASQIDLAWPYSDIYYNTLQSLERCQNIGCENFSEINQPTTAIYSDTGLNLNTVYCYRLKVTDLGGGPPGGDITLGTVSSKGSPTAVITYSYYSNIACAQPSATPPPPNLDWLPAVLHILLN